MELIKKGKYGKPETFSVNGIFSGHPKGFGFVTVEGMDRDVFIPEDRTGQALNGDRVQIVMEMRPGGTPCRGNRDPGAGARQSGGDRLLPEEQGIRFCDPRQSEDRGGRV